jgi:hypothetical protein
MIMMTTPGKRSSVIAMQVIWRRLWYSVDARRKARQRIDGQRAVALSPSCASRPYRRLPTRFGFGLWDRRRQIEDEVSILIGLSVDEARR